MGTNIRANDQASSAVEQPKKVSCAIKLGSTHVLCALVAEKQDGSVLSQREPRVLLSLTLVKDSSLMIRRDLLEEKEI